MAAGIAVPRRVAGIFLAFVMMAGLLWGYEAPAVAAPGDACPDIKPKSELAEGQTGRALTVVEGTQPQEIDVEILGVAPNYLLPGVDLVVVDLSGPVIDELGGGWAGISGSPVYIGDELAGALAWGLSFGPSSVMGMTTAEDMSKVLAYDSTSPTRLSGPTRTYPERVELTDRLRRKIARSAGVAPKKVGSSMGRLPMPLSISGVGAARMGLIEKTIERENVPFIPHAGSAASLGPEPSAEPMAAGRSFSAALSYGDVTAAGTGTATYVCGEVALAFGHYFDFGGETLLGANQATTFAIVDDDVYGAYKFARLDGTVGIVDQDRFTAIRARLGEGPETVPVDSLVSVPAATRSRSGKTEVVQQTNLPFLAFIHALGNIDSVFDRIGKGSASATWTATGTRADGAQWTYTRTNIFASNYDIAYAAIGEFANHLFAFVGNPFEDVKVTDVDISFELDDVLRLYRISSLEVSNDKGRTFKAKRWIKVKPGSKLVLRVTLAPHEGDPVVRDLSMRLPKKLPRRSMVYVQGGGSYDDELYCLFYPEECGSSTNDGPVQDFDGLLSYLEDQPRNNVLRAEHVAGAQHENLPEVFEEMDAVVSGSKRLVLVKVTKKARQRRAASH